MTRRLAILAFIALAVVASAQYSDVRIHASRPTEQGPEVWLAESLPELLYTNCVLWLPFPKAYTSTQYSFAVARATNDLTISGAVWTNESSGAMYFDGNDDLIFRAPGLFNIEKHKGYSFFVWLKINDDSVAEQDTAFGWTDNKPVVQLHYLTNSIQFWTRDVNGVLVNAQCRAYDHDERPTFICGTHDATGQIRSLYTNGYLAASLSVGEQTNIITTTRNSVIGARNTAGTVGLYFRGIIYEVGIFSNYCITSNEQFDYYNQTRSRYGL